MDVDEGANQNLDLLLRWIRQYGHLLEAFVHMPLVEISHALAHIF